MKREIDSELLATACGGEFFLCGEEFDSSAYDDDEVDGESEPDWVEFRKGDVIEKISTFDMLIEFLRQDGCDLVDEASRNPLGVSLVIGELLRRGRVVADRELWGFLEEDYGVSLSGHMPRLDGRVLHFTVSAPHSPGLGAGRQRLIAIAADLLGGAVIFDEMEFHRKSKV